MKNTKELHKFVKSRLDKAKKDFFTAKAQLRNYDAQYNAGETHAFARINYQLTQLQKKGKVVNGDPNCENQVKDERQKCIDQIHQILGTYGEDREDIKSDFREMCKYLKNI